MPVDLAAELARPTVIDANALLWAARILEALVRVHRNVIPDMREKVKVARAILESYAEVPDFDPREQRWRNYYLTSGAAGWSNTYPQFTALPGCPLHGSRRGLGESLGIRLE
jgi:hypothetical protein